MTLISFSSEMLIDSLMTDDISSLFLTPKKHMLGCVLPEKVDGTTTLQPAARLRMKVRGLSLCVGVSSTSEHGIFWDIYIYIYLSYTILLIE